MIKQLLQKFVFALCILFVASCGTADIEIKNATTIWQGFEHVWEYNHRVNRMGDWLTDINYENGFAANSYHAAASGIGPDKCDYSTFLTQLSTSKDIYFKAISKEIILSGMEETVDSQLININLDFPLINDAAAVVLLNGFDMYARPIGSENLLGDGDADKLFNFSILPQTPAITNNGNHTSVSFDVIVTLGGACSSPECSSGSNNDFFDYLVTTNFQVLVANNTLMTATPKTISNQYEWERPRNNNSSNGEIFQSDYLITNETIQGISGVENAFLGIQSFQFKTEKGWGGFNGQSFEYPHMQTFNMAVQQSHYNSADGTLLFDAQLFFKNWASPVPIFSFGSGGKVDFKLTASAVQLADPKAIIENIKIVDDIIWFINPLAPAQPNTEASLNYHPISIY